MAYRKASLSGSHIIVALFVLAIIGFIAMQNRHELIRSVAGVSIMRGFYEKASVSLPKSPSASSFNIYYRRSTDTGFPYSVRNIPATQTSYTILYLRKGILYQYKIAAVGKDGQEIWFSDVEQFTSLQPM